MKMVGMFFVFNATQHNNANPQALRHKTSWYLKLRHHTQKETQNFINSMVTAIVSRKREFAVIQSVGMTKKQLNRMLVNEGLFYAVLTLVASYLLSSLPWALWSGRW